MDRDLEQPDGTAPPALLASRYGTHRPVARVALIVVTVLLAGAGLGWLAWAAWFASNQPIQAEIVGFDVVDQHRVDATLDLVLRDRDVTGTCLLRASAADHSIVGELDIRVEEVPADQDVFTVRTEREATTVEKVRCTPDRR